MLSTPQSTQKRSRSKSVPSAPKKIARKRDSASISMGSVITKRVPRGIPVGCPKEMRVKLMYHCQTVMAAPAAGIAAYTTYRANGPFDPEVAIGGAQPRYYDEWSAIYQQVTTVKSKITCQFANEQYDTSIRNCLVGVAHTSNSQPLVSTATLTKTDAMELTHSNYRLASNNNAVYPSITWSPDQYFIGKTIYDEELASGTGATPQRPCYFHVWVTPDVTIGGAYPDRTFNVTIEYDVIFFDPVIPLQS